MKTNSKTAKANSRTCQNKTGIDPQLIAAYRAYPEYPFTDSIKGMKNFLVHRDAFESLDNMPMVEAAERAWWADAVLLSAAETSNAETARRKVAALAPALDGRPWHIVGEGLRAIQAMITVACALEQRRWGIEAPTRH